MTGQTVPGRRIPGHWPTPVPEALAVAEPVTLVKGWWRSGPWSVRPFSFLLPPHERVLAKLGRHGRTNFSMSRLRGLPALLLGLAARVE